MSLPNEKSMAVQEPTVVHHESHLDPTTAKQEPHMTPADGDDASDQGNLIYDNNDEEPELHLRTYIALAAFFLLNFVQIVALQGPPSVLSFISADLKNTTATTWVPTSLSLVQAVLCPVIASLSDTFQSRKTVLLGAISISFIGCCIAPGSKDIYRVIAAQVLIGVGFATTPITYCVPSEIVPRKWTPIAQAIVNVAAAFGSIAAPLSMGAMTRNNPHQGWRTFYWIQAGLWAAVAAGIFFGYRPPKRHTRFDHLTVWQKIKSLDLPGFFLLTAGLVLFLTGLNLGGGLYSWTAAPTLATMVVGLATLVVFGLYEWKGTSTGILHHDLFRGGKNHGRTFALCLGLISIEVIILFAYLVFNPVLTIAIYESDPFLEVVRSQPYWIASGLCTVIYAYVSSKLRDIRGPLFVGYFILTGGTVALATLQPGDSTNSIIFGGLSGIGFAAPLVLIVAAVQLCSPHNLIATSTALTTSARAVAATVFTAIYAASVDTRIDSKVPTYIAKAALGAGLPPSSVTQFVEALVGKETSVLPQIPGVTPAVIAAGIAGLKQATADSIRVVYIIAAPFSLLACIMTLFIGDLTPVMTYRVEAPVEKLHAKHYHHHQDQSGQDHA
ncbi:hypothetical protein CLAIMM_14988 [Cladophialophora immunda]|nr:hypothetical protein CLAIMM_14988 [Cladophialophora immunda]